MSAVQHSGRWWSIAREYKPPAYTGYLQDSIANAVVTALTTPKLRSAIDIDFLQAS